MLLPLWISAALADPPVPLLEDGHPVDWWFAFKLDSAAFPGCAGEAQRACSFGGEVQPYKHWSQQYVVASSEHPSLDAGAGCLGDGGTDPVGATFGQVYQGSWHYVVWNDQLYGSPRIQGCGQSCGAPWGHSKGLLAWDDEGEGLVLQVSTPSWPASGSAAHPRDGDGNTLGCVLDDDVLVSQHFFALRLDHDDTVAVLRALALASVVTNPDDPRLVENGGPDDVRALVGALGKRSRETVATEARLSTGVVLLAKPSKLQVPPWQLVSARLEGTPLLTATWWMRPAIPPTEADTAIGCWDPALGTPGPVGIATTGAWGDRTFRLRGGASPDANHAKIGVSTDEARPYVVFGDLNQQGALDDRCSRSQNGRGGLFYVVEDPALRASVASLLGREPATR